MSLKRTAPSPPADRWAYLRRRAELLRHAAIGSLIRTLGGQGQVIELGAGHGELLHWLDPGQIDSYLAVDLETGPVAGLRHDTIAIETVACPIEAFTPPRQPIAALVASEVLYYVEAPHDHLLRIWRAAGPIDIVLISSVLPRPDRPNWQRSYNRVRDAVTSTGWPVLETVQITSAADRLAWEIVALKPGRAEPADQI